MCKVVFTPALSVWFKNMWNVQVYPFYYLNGRYRKLYNRVPIEKQKKTHLPDSDFYSCSTSAETPKHRHTNTPRQTDSRTHILESMRYEKCLAFWLNWNPNINSVVYLRKEVLVAQSCLTLQPHAWTVACQAPLSMEFSRTKYGSGLPFPSPGKSSHPVSCIAGMFFTIWAINDSWFRWFYWVTDWFSRKWYSFLWLPDHIQGMA